jgi:hypothetical protein
MPRKQPPKDYYTATQVKQMLDISDGMLHTYVQKGKLHRVVPEGRAQGFYPRKEVDKLANELKAFFAPEKPSSIFMKATKEDMPECVALSSAIFGGLNIIPLEKRIAWLEKNPDIDYVLRSDGQMMGYATFVPLKPEKIEKLLKEEEFSKNMTPDEIGTFEPGKPLHVYIMAMGIRPGISRDEKRHYGSRLITGTMEAIIELGKKGVIIDTFVARSDTPDGINLLRHIGFTEIPSTIPGTRNFIIEVEKSGIPAIMQYKRALQESVLLGEKNNDLVPSLKKRPSIKALPL